MKLSYRQLNTVFSLSILFLFFTSIAVGQGPIPAPVSIRWKAVKGSTKYEFQFGREGRILDSFTSTTNSWDGKVLCGPYDFRIRSFDQRGVPGPWSKRRDVKIKLSQIQPEFPNKTLSVKKRGSLKAVVPFRWKSIGPGVTYKIIVKDSDEEEIASKITSSNSAKIILPVAKEYSWVVIPLARSCEFKGEPKNQKFQIIGPRLKTPKLVKESSKHITSLSWNKPPQTENYYLRLDKRVSGKWVEAFKEEESEEQGFKVNEDYETGVYRFIVRANGTLRHSSKPTIAVFEHEQKYVPKHLFDVTIGFTPMLKTYDVKSEVIDADINAFLYQAGELALAYSYRRYFETFVSYQFATRSLSFPDEASGEATELNLSYSDLQLGLEGNLPFEQFSLGLRLFGSQEKTNSLTADDLKVVAIDNNLQLVGVSLIPRFTVWIVKANLLFSYRHLLKSETFDFKDYSEMRTGFGVEKMSNERLAGGFYYTFGTVSFKYVDDLEVSIENSTLTHELGVYMKLLL